ncbi:alpha/beta-hydrolase [Athelia psychrophila]|uniref:Alpha/beta-hydrolase n=1 Tax=Athelia psychrophila TaxID=1759441 RepID=A0A166TDZ0_9AGAM|nr:alpha/beta-hydrolase [Fibularhizoctonia sp. CBS 109695]
MSHCDACFQGVRHEGEPEGNYKKIGDVECYVATPKGDHAKDKAVLFLTDVFGMQLVNNRLLTDDFANNGFKTILVDLFGGEPYPEDYLSGGAANFNREEWMTKNDYATTRHVLDKVIAALKADGVEKLGSTGYCYGARHVFDLAFDSITAVSVVAHPTRFQIPDDLEKYLNNAKAPLLINSCTVDRAFPEEAQIKADETLGDGKFTPGYRRAHWEGCTHGFAVRGDMSDPKVKAGKEGAFKESVEWFRKYL